MGITRFMLDTAKADPVSAATTAALPALSLKFLGPQETAANFLYMDPERKAKAMTRRALAAEHFQPTFQKQAAGKSGLAAEHLLGETLSKLPSPLKLMLAGAALSTGMAVGGGAAAATAYGLGRVSEKVHATTEPGQYLNMLKVAPGLRLEPQARDYFRTLHRIAPSIAREPREAANAVATMLEAPDGLGLNPRMVQDVLKAEELSQKTRFPILRGPQLRGEMAGLAG